MRVSHSKLSTGRWTSGIGLLLVLLLSGCFLIWMRSTQASTEAGAPVLIAETGHTLAYGFREFYEQHGGTSIFGLPLTEVYLEHGRPVQYFERARLEWHARSCRRGAGSASPALGTAVSADRARHHRQ